MVLVARGADVRDVPDSLYLFMLNVGYQPVIGAPVVTPPPLEPTAGSVPAYDPASKGYLPKALSQMASDVRSFDPPAVPKVDPLLFMSLTDRVIANTAAETSTLASSFAGNRTISANRLKVGSTIAIQGNGLYSLPLLSPGSALLRIKLGSVTLALATVNGALLGGVLQTNAPFDFQCSLVCRTDGVSGTMAPGGTLNFNVPNTGSRAFFDLLNGGADVAVDTTVDQVLDVTFQWATASASRSVTIRQTAVSIS